MAIDIGITLPAGTVAVYGPGKSERTATGLLLPTNFRVGTVYNIWAGGETYVYGGDQIYWDETKVQPTRLVTQNNITMTIIPARLATVDNAVV